MSGPCSSYRIEGDAASGPCLHPAGYLAWDDDLGEIDYCACHYGEPHDPAECRRRHAALVVTKEPDAPRTRTTPVKHAALGEDPDLFEAPEGWTQGGPLHLPALAEVVRPRSARSHASAGQLGEKPGFGFELGAL